MNEEFVLDMFGWKSIDYGSFVSFDDVSDEKIEYRGSEYLEAYLDYLDLYINHSINNSGEINIPKFDRYLREKIKLVAKFGVEASENNLIKFDFPYARYSLGVFFEYIFKAGDGSPGRDRVQFFLCELFKTGETGEENESIFYDVFSDEDNMALHFLSNRDLSDKSIMEFGVNKRIVDYFESTYLYDELKKQIDTDQK